MAPRQPTWHRRCRCGRPGMRTIGPRTTRITNTGDSSDLAASRTLQPAVACSSFHVCDYLILSFAFAFASHRHACACCLLRCTRCHSLAHVLPVLTPFGGVGGTLRHANAIGFPRGNPMGNKVAAWMTRRSIHSMTGRASATCARPDRASRRVARPVACRYFTNCSNALFLKAEAGGGHPLSPHPPPPTHTHTHRPNPSLHS